MLFIEHITMLLMKQKCQTAFHSETKVTLFPPFNTDLLKLDC